MLRYFYFPPTCSLAAMVALEVTGAPYEGVAVPLAGDRSELRSYNPSGKVPTLVSEEDVVSDTIAIIFWLARRYPDAQLLPTEDMPLTRALSQMARLGSTAHILRRRFARPMEFAADEQAQLSIRATAEPLYRAEIAHLDRTIETGELSALGVKAYALLFYHWALLDGLPVDHLSSFRSLVDDMLDRPGVRKALERHSSPLLGFKGVAG